MFWWWYGTALTIRLGLDFFTKAGRHRGYVSRFVNKFLHFPPSAPSYIIPWLGIDGAATFLTKDPLTYVIVWGSYILMALDDYFNGDDDFHKKIKKAANKIKWKMTQPRLIPRPE